MIAQLAERIAAALHENWREEYRRISGDTPRVKHTTDWAWIGRTGMSRVDIATTAFADLPDDWRQENLSAATVLLDYLQPRLGQLAELRTNNESRAAAGDHIHAAWLARNSWARGGELDVPFNQLAVAERNKDLAQLDIAIAVMAP